MPAAAWIAIGVFAAGTLWAVFWWAVRRHIARIDQLEHHIHEPNGCVSISTSSLRDALARCVTEEDLDMNLAPVTRQLAQIVEEGRERERRLQDAMAKVADAYADGQRTVRTDISGIHQRIDRIYDLKGNPR